MIDRGLSSSIESRVEAQTPRRAGRPKLNQPGIRVESRDRILAEAAKLFVELGYSATSTRDIAAAVGIRQASLFHHFARKDEILVELIDRSLNGILDVSRWMQPRRQQADVALWTLIRHDTETLCSDPMKLGSLIRLPEVRAPIFDSMWVRRAELEAAYRGLIETGIGNGCFIDRDAAVLTKLLFSLSEGTIDWYSADGDLSASAAAGEVADGALRLILKSPSRLAAVARRGQSLLEAFRNETDGPGGAHSESASTH